MVKAAKKDRDYRVFKSNRITTKDYVPEPGEKDRQILDSMKQESKCKGRHHFKRRMDEITGKAYKFKRQLKYLNLCGHKGMGLFTLVNLKAQTIGFVSKRPGVPMPLTWVCDYKKEGCFFVGRNYYPNNDHTMKSNIISMKNEHEREEVNASLQSHSKEFLNSKGVMVSEEGMYAVIFIEKDVKANSFINLGTYDNTKDFGFGTSTYLEFEQQVIRQYKAKMVQKKLQGPRFQVCKNCCDIFENTKRGKARDHERDCSGNLLTYLWLNK